MSAMASPSVNLPHQPVDTVHIPNPTSETFKFDLRRTRYFIKRHFTLGEIGLANWKRVVVSVELECRLNVAVGADMDSDCGSNAKILRDERMCGVN